MAGGATRCQVCNSTDQASIEECGVRALSGELSWRAAAEKAGLKYSQPLRVHMENHYVSPEREAAAQAVDAYVGLLDELCNDLIAEMELAPANVKPLYLVAIHNARELRNTKPSQQNLITALRTIQEMTGMKQQQQLMLTFAKAHFKKVENEHLALASPDVIDVEEVPNG